MPFLNHLSKIGHCSSFSSSLEVYGLWGLEECKGFGFRFRSSAVQGSRLQSCCVWGFKAWRAKLERPSDDLVSEFEISDRFGCGVGSLGRRLGVVPGSGFVRFRISAWNE